MKRATIFIIHFISNFFKAGGLRACRFHPSCSQYAAQAFETLSWGRAFWLMCKRLLRCQPFSRGGYDPLAEKS